MDGRSEGLPAVQQDGHRPVVDQGHLHVGAEAPRLHPQALGLQQGLDGLAQRLGHLGPGGLYEIRASAVPGVGQQRELAHQQHRAAHVRKAQVHLVVFVLEHPQTGDLLGAVAGVGLGVPGLSADEHHEAVVDGARRLAVYGDGGDGDLLYDAAHGLIPPGAGKLSR